MTELIAELFHSRLQCQFWRPRCLVFANNNENSITRLIFPQNLSQSLTLDSCQAADMFAITLKFRIEKPPNGNMLILLIFFNTMLGNMQKANFARLQWKHFCVYGSHCIASSKRHMTRRSMCGWRGRLRYFQ